MKKLTIRLPLFLQVFLFLGIFVLFSLALFRTPALFSFLLFFGLDRGIAVANPHNPDVFFTLGENFFGHGRVYDVVKAEKFYSKSIALRPDFLEAHYQLGRVYFIQGRFYPALTEIKTVLRLDPEFKKAYYMYGLISGYQKNYDEALYGFSEFIKRDDFNWAGYNDLAWIYFQKGDYEKTRETAKEGLKRATTNPWLHNIYGTALMNLGEKEAAKEAFIIALNEAEKMSPADWGGAYPGNDKRLYEQGLAEMEAAIQHNLQLLQNPD
jgi:tetratricopeptide (TPR) repeat protein